MFVAFSFELATSIFSVQSSCSKTYSKLILNKTPNLIIRETFPKKTVVFARHYLQIEYFIIFFCFKFRETLASCHDRLSVCFCDCLQCFHIVFCSRHKYQISLKSKQLSCEIFEAAASSNLMFYNIKFSR